MNVAEFWIAVFVLIVSRVGMFVSTFPLFSSTNIPRSVKAALVVSLSSMWMWDFAGDASQFAAVPVQITAVGYGLAVAREAVIGGMFGFALGLFFLPAQVAGAYLGQEMGFSMAGITDPTTQVRSNVLADVVNSLAMLVFFASDFHHLAIGTLYASFGAMPLGGPLELMQMSVFSAGMSEAHRWGLELAAPVGIGLLLTTVVLAVLMKISPQLNLFSIGTPLRLIIGLLTFFLLLPDFVRLMQHIFYRSNGFVYRLGF